MLNISKNTLIGWAPSVLLHHRSTLAPITLCQSVTPHLTFASRLFSTSQQLWRRSPRCHAHESAVPLTESFADVRHGLEDAVREVDLDLHVLHVGQLEAQELVLWREEQPGVGLDAVLVQRPVGFQQPCLLLLPPQGMVWPVLFHIYGGAEKRRED